jgi:hypothetical protein
VTDSGGLQGTATRTVIITAPLLPPVDTVASSQTAVSGSVTGSYTLTHTANSQHQSIKEVETNGNPNKRYSYLEHKWVFSVPTGGATRSFHVKAYQSVSTDGDNFIFAYSTNNSTWTNMVTVTSTSASGQNLSFTLPPTLSGTVYVRVKDTNQAQGHRELNTVYVDHLYIRKQ